MKCHEMTLLRVWLLLQVDVLLTMNQSGCSTSFRRWQEFVVTELAPTHHSKENSQRSFTTHRFTVILSALSSLSDTHIISTKTFTFTGRHPAESYGKQEHIYFHIACLCKCMLTNTYCVHNSFALCPIALPHCCTVEVNSMQVDYTRFISKKLFLHNIAHLTRLSSKLNPSAFVLMPQLCYIHLWLLREFPEGI